MTAVDVAGEQDDLAALRADRDTLARVTEDLVDARVALRMVRSGLTPRARKSLDEGATFVRLDAYAARILLALDDE